MSEAIATRIVRLKVEGMGCDGCVAAVQAALEGAPGVITALVELKGGTAEVEAAAATDPGTLVAAVTAEGYDAHIMG